MAASRARPVPAAGVYEIDPTASTVRFDTRAVFGMVPVRGAFAITHGQIVVADPAEQSSVHVVVAAGSFASGNRQRDAHVRSPDYLDVARHPDIAFRSLRLQGTGTGATLFGELTVCGVTQPTALALGPVVQQDDRMAATATTTVDRYAFGLTRARGMTGRHLRVLLDVVAHR